MSAPSILLLTSPGDRLPALPPGVVRVHLAYQLGAELHLLRCGPVCSRSGGILAISDCGRPLTGSPLSLCRQAERECLSQGARGLLLDFDRRLPVLADLVRALAPVCLRRGWELYLPEYYAPLAAHSKVLVSSALSGGTLSTRLSQALEQFGPERMVLALERACEDFTLPAPTGCGHPLSPQALDRLRRRFSPTVFFSRELCARYFTYRGEDGIHFVLFDDHDTLCHKLAVARQAGVRTILIPWQEAKQAPDRFGLFRPAAQESAVFHAARTSQNFSAKK